ncbi:MAG: methylmalonyl Co-A mutase-associated GTPase MeaB [Thermoprotei archaeon]
MVNDLIVSALKGDQRSIARIASEVEYFNPSSSEILLELMKMSGRSHVIGITGAPGSGKSTLIARLIDEFRSKDLKVAVIAVDPSSPFSQGALMGNRIRMQKHATDPKVFIRSLATRGYRGGISAAALALVEVFDGLGYDKILIETVGVGQTDVDIMYAAHTIVVLVNPGTGDEIQALKAGIMEIGDIYVISKSDKPEAEDAFKQVLFGIEGGILGRGFDWKPAVLKVSAMTGQGVKELADKIDEHLKYVKKSDKFYQQIKSRRLQTFKSSLSWFIENKLEESLKSNVDLNDIIEQVKNGKESPYDAVLKIVKKLF